MKSLDDFIKNNAASFDSDDPLDGHQERFEKRLAVSESSLNLMLFLRIAAVIILATVISYAAYREFSQLKPNTGRVFSYTNSSELIEAEAYYSDQMTIFYSKLNHMQFNNDKVQKKQILNELTDMDRQVRNMKRDLRQNPDDERVVNAIMNYYQTKLDFMDMIINRTNQSYNTIL